MKSLTELATPFAAIAQNSVLIGHDLPWLQTLRLQALTQFQQQGLPSKKQEDWKYTSLWPLAQQQFTHQAASNTVNKAQQQPPALLADSYQIVMMDGQFSPELSNIDDQLAGVTIRPLSASLAELQQVLGQQLDLKKPGLTALNTALMNQGIVIDIAAGVKLVKPIELVVINSGTSDALASHLRHIIMLAEHSQATVIEHYLALQDVCYFTNVVTEVVLAEHAQLNHYKLQQEARNAFHIATLAAKQAAYSQWRTTSIALGAKLARNDIHSQLLAEQANVVMDGLYLTNDQQHTDFHTRIDHKVANTSSSALFKGVLAGNSHAVFNGKVMVAKDAQHTDANQQNHNLLLSRHCQIDTKPEMEIYADDVKCGHGSTVGQLDPQQLFLLRTRGLDEMRARSILTYAFAIQVLDGIQSEPIRQALAAAIKKQLAQGEAS